MNRTDTAAFGELMAEVAACYDRKEYPPAALKTWFRELEEFPFGQVQAYMRTWIRTKQKPPVISDILVPLAERLSSSIEARALADKRSEVLPTQVTAVGREAMAKIRDLLSSPRKPGRWWAYELRDRHRQGERLGQQQIELARRACGSDWDSDRPYQGAGQVDRIPGSDDE